MKKNMGILDRSVRVIIAIVFLVLLFLKVIEGTLGIVLVVFATVFILTSLIGFCPLYPLLGINTCERK